MDESEREDSLYHGTTIDVAQRIKAQGSFSMQETYFAQDRELAEYFARRSALKRGRGTVAAVIRVALYQSDLKSWKRSKLVLSKGFDEGDRPEFRGKTQLVFSADAMKLLNLYMFRDELSIERVG